MDAIDVKQLVDVIDRLFTVGFQLFVSHNSMWLIWHKFLLNTIKLNETTIFFCILISTFCAHQFTPFNIPNKSKQFKWIAINRVDLRLLWTISLCQIVTILIELQTQFSHFSIAHTWVVNFHKNRNTFCSVFLAN